MSDGEWKEDTEAEVNGEEIVEEPKEEVKGLPEDEVNRRIEKARQQEKDKLYDTISTLKDQVTELTKAQKAEQEEKEKARKDAEERADKERLASLSAEEKFVEQLKKFEEQLAYEREAREELAEEAQRERELRHLEQYKAELLREAGDEIIPELVTGDSKEEIERNAALAKSRYQQIFDATAEKAKGNKHTPKMPPPTDPDPSAMEEAELRQSLSNLDVDPLRYAGGGQKGQRVKRDDAYVAEVDKKRDDLMKSIEAAYKKSLSG